MQLTKLDPFSERIVAAFNSEMPSGDSYGAPIVISFFDKQHEVCIQQGKHIINLQAGDVRAVCNELNRAATLAMSQERE